MLGSPLRVVVITTRTLLYTYIKFSNKSLYIHCKKCGVTECPRGAILSCFCGNSVGYHGNMKILLPWGVLIHHIFYSVAAYHACTPRHLSPYLINCYYRNMRHEIIVARVGCAGQLLKLMIAILSMYIWHTSY